MSKNRRLLPKDRRAEILQSALKVATVAGYDKLTRAQVAAHANCAESLISAYFGTMCKFKRTIMRTAIKEKELTIIAQGLVAGDKYARKADKSLITASLASIT